MLKHIKDPKKLEQAKKALADSPRRSRPSLNKTEGIARYARLFTEGYVDAIATNGKVTVWSNDTAYGSLVFAPANDVMHPTAVSPLDWAAPYTATPMRFFGDNLYVNEDGSIWVFDCADPNNIGFVGYYDVSCWGGTPDFDVHGGYLWVACDTDRFIAFKLGNMIPSLVADPVHGSGNFASLGGYDIDRIRVSDRCAIVVESSSGTVFLWDITNMVDPEQDVILYPNGAVFNNPWIPFFNGQNAFEDISQMELVQGYIFLANSMSNNAGPGTDMGVTRIVWPDETNPDSLNSVAPGLNSVNDSVNGPGKYINHFEVYGTGTYVYTAFDNSNDYFLGGATYDGLAGEKWDWSDALNPSIALDYKMDRYFYNYNYKIVGDTTATPVFLNNGPFYGGASIAFSPVTDPTGTYDAFVAGFNYVGVFNTAWLLHLPLHGRHGSHRRLGRRRTDPRVLRPQRAQRQRRLLRPLLVQRRIRHHGSQQLRHPHGFLGTARPHRLGPQRADDQRQPLRAGCRRPLRPDHRRPEQPGPPHHRG